MTEYGRDGSRTPSVDDSGGDQESGDMAEHSEPKIQANGNGLDVAQNGQKSTATNSKDPLRPRRKKARRACFACQRAHLTCGDERPCQRCIKRGLQDACHDGVRKKAKYLHDAPDGALMPGNFYNQTASMRANPPFTMNGAKSQQSSNAFYHRPPFNVYEQNKPQGQMTSQMLPENALTQNSFNAPSPTSPTFALTANPSLPVSMAQQSSDPASSAATAPSQNAFGGPFFDPSDPALFNFDLASMNFGSHYGALEFGVLGHLATGAGDTPPSDAGTAGTQHGSIGQRFPTPVPGSGFESPGNQPSFMFSDPILNDWPNSSQPSGPVNVGTMYNQGNMVPGPILKQEEPLAYAIESGNFASPGSMNSLATNLDDTPGPSLHSTVTIPKSKPPLITTPRMRQQSLSVGMKRRLRNPSSIYESVKEPYSYTSGFHSLTAFIQRRFSPQKTLRIAKALASIRPSFIATTRTLNQDDLIFMEKCFQRTLWEYEDFINACGTPTIVCRRTGEIAAVGKEFSVLTGWKKEVLLGKEPNLNVNTGSFSGTSSRASFTPRIPTQEAMTVASGRIQPVFLAELLDDDSVIEFYEDFARLAFGDSRGSVMTTCRLLKYRTKEDLDLTKSEDNRYNSHFGKSGIAGESGMNQLGFKDGKVECSYCWTVKRDVFDIPMLIIMNFLPQI
jgi:hypothetical protein